MSRMIGAATTRLRLWLALVVGGALTLLTPSLFAATLDAPTAAVLMAVALALAAVAVLLSHVAAPVPGALTPRSRAADEAPPVLASRVTDPLHHPLRPRAPGLV
jgi:hypothetical protein